MTRFTRKLAVFGTTLSALALAAGSPAASVAHAQLPFVEVNVTAAPLTDAEAEPIDSHAAPAEPAALPVDAAAVRVELARALGAFVVAPGSANPQGVTPVAVVQITLGADSATVVVRRPAPSEETVEVSFHGAVTEARLVGLVVTLIGPVAPPPQRDRAGMDVRVNPYRDRGVSVARLDPRPPASGAFLMPNPYRTRSTDPAVLAAPMPLGRNPYLL
jgi:hypothetical protein